MKYQTAQRVGLEHPPQEFARPEEMSLAEELFKLSRPHPGRQGRRSSYIGPFRPPKQRLLLSATAEPGEAFLLELWARNPNDQLKDYVVLPVLNFQQVPFAGSEILHLRMPAGSELFIPGQIQLPDEEGVHELQFITIFEPYQPLDEVRDPFVQSIMRSALVIKGRK